MYTWVRQRLREEEGLSLVEILVSIMLVGMILAGLANTMTTSMAAARQSEGLTHATALASQEFETLQGIRWERLGLYTSDPNYTPTAAFGSLTLHTVQVPASVSGAPAVRTTGITRGNRTYTVRRFIVWRCNTAAETGAGCPDTAPRYKQFRVQVSWTEGGTTKTTQMEGKRSIGTGGVGGGGSTLDLSDGNIFRVVSLTVTPDPIYVHNNGRLVTSDPALCATPPAAPQPGCGPRLPNPANTSQLAALQIDVETSHAASGVTVHWGGTPVAMTQVAGSSGLRWYHQIFAGDNSAFAPPGPLDMAATATQAATGATDSDATQAYIAYPIAVNTGAFYFDSNGWRTTADPRICIKNTDKLVRNDHQFILGIRGLTMDDQAWLGRDGTVWKQMAFGQDSWQTDPAQTVYHDTATIAQIGAINTTGYTFRISWLRSYDGVAGQWNFPVSVTTVGNGYTGAC